MKYSHDMPIAILYTNIVRHSLKRSVAQTISFILFFFSTCLSLVICILQMGFSTLYFSLKRLVLTIDALSNFFFLN